MERGTGLSLCSCGREGGCRSQIAEKDEASWNRTGAFYLTDDFERNHLFWDDSDSSATWHTYTGCPSWTKSNCDIPNGTVTFSDHDLIDPVWSPFHNRPLYVPVLMRGLTLPPNPPTGAFFDNGSSINRMPLRICSALGCKVRNFTPTKMIVHSVTDTAPITLGYNMLQMPVDRWERRRYNECYWCYSFLPSLTGATLDPSPSSSAFYLSPVPSIFSQPYN